MPYFLSSKFGQNSACQDASGILGYLQGKGIQQFISQCPRGTDNQHYGGSSVKTHLRNLRFFRRLGKLNWTPFE